LQHIEEGEDQFLHASSFKLCQALANGIWTSNQSAICAIAKASEQSRGNLCSGLLIGVGDQAERV
jgi:hypothetical protein